ncbi:MAG: serine/threonine protein kinase [Candidatus Sericytochromatia bacterium]
MSEAISNLREFDLLEQLSVHQHREVYKASKQTGETVIVKRLNMGQISDWKAMELFEREARMLQSLQHPRIPRLLDFFHEQNPEGVVLTMVMEHIAGPTLAERLDGGWRPPEAEVLEIARQGLELLKWLHGRQPTALHRDIKPSNLIWTDTGELYLIDFGAVKELFISKGSSTVIGTFGYMAPEQFIGQSVPASDLYGLGATLLHLLAGRAPAEIPQLGLRLDFRPYVSCSIELQRLLERWLEPYLADRLTDADSAIAELETLTRNCEHSPTGRIVLESDGQSHVIRIAAYQNPFSVYLQHKLLLAQAAAVFGCQVYLWFALLKLKNDWDPLFNDNPGCTVFLLGLSVGYIYFLSVLICKLHVAAQASLELHLDSEQLIVKRLLPKAEQILISRKAIQRVDKYRLMDEFGVRIKPTSVSVILYPWRTHGAASRTVDLAMGLGKRDQHWLMTKLLQYCYRTSYDIVKSVESSDSAASAPTADF